MSNLLAPWPLNSSHSGQKIAVDWLCLFLCRSWPANLALPASTLTDVSIDMTITICWNTKDQIDLILLGGL